MKILILGGTGFLGSHIVRKLLERKHELTLLTRDPGRDMPFDKTKISFIKGDILQLDSLMISGDFDVLVFTAMVPFKPGRVSEKRFRELVQLTRLYFQNTIELAKRLACPLILTSGASFVTKNDEVADEHWPIARRGMAAIGTCYDELVSMIRKDQAPALIEMLPGQIYGRGGLFSTILAMAEKGKIVILGGGRNYLPRIHVEDCAEAYVLAIEQLPLGKRFIVCDDEHVRVKDFTLFLAGLYGVKKVITIPKFLLRIAMGKYIFKTLTMNTKVSNRLLKQELGWFPKYPSYREGLAALKS